MSIPDGPQGDKQQALRLSWLAAAFVQYSSCWMFGTADESPMPLRCYAVALVRAADELDAALPPTESAQWISKLLGNDYSCAASLFTGMCKTLYAHSKLRSDDRGLQAQMTLRIW